MEYHFISDDSFFLHGIQGIKLPERKKHLLHHAGMLSGKKHPQRGDIVVVNIADITRRKQILQSPWVTYCRVIILLRTKKIMDDIRISENFPGSFLFVPVNIRWQISLSAPRPVNPFSKVSRIHSACCFITCVVDIHFLSSKRK